MKPIEAAILDSEEQEIEDNIDFSKAIPVAEKSALMSSLREASVRKPITLRMEGADLEAIKRLAEQEGMPYQTLIGSLVHKYVTGALVDINEVRKVIPLGR
jgi:predicted DNA binding CopG/RHH family protein